MAGLTLYINVIVISNLFLNNSNCRLFHIIVDSDKTAAHILSIMNKQKLPGEVTFMPLNRLQSKEQEYPSSPVGDSLII